MSYLSSAITRMKKLGEVGLPKPPTTQPEVQKNFTLLDGSVGSVEPEEELIPFLERTEKTEPFNISRTSLNRILRGVWCEPKFDALALRALKHANADRRRSSDQAIIEGYLSWFPNNRNIIEQLSKAAHNAAMRHEWAWKKRSSSVSLFKSDMGPIKVAKKLTGSLDQGVEELIAGLGLGHNLAASGFGQAVFISACELVAERKGTSAVLGQKRLMEMLDADKLAPSLSSIARALLQPWISNKPDPSHRKAISNLLLDQIGDPRTNPLRWQNITSDIEQVIGAEKAEAVVKVLKRWLTDAAMREFFRAIMETTDRRDQWQQREKFWLAYLDAGLVLDAWPALGTRASNRIEQIFHRSKERSDYGKTFGGYTNSSSIIMQIGDIRIVEWSDDGACRFWSDHDETKPQLYQQRYDARKLRTTSGGEGFDYLVHQGNWQPKFANFIYRLTKIEHPIHGSGWTSYY